MVENFEIVCAMVPRDGVKSIVISTRKMMKLMNAGTIIDIDVIVKFCWTPPRIDRFKRTTRTNSIHDLQWMFRWFLFEKSKMIATTNKTPAIL